MDPFSILDAVVTGGKTLLAITESILGFVDEVQTITQSIQGVYDEVDSLRRTLDAINHSLASSLLSNAIAGSQVTSALWPPVLKYIQDCELTIRRLYDILQGLKRQTFGVPGRTVTAIKFSRSDREVQVLKGRFSWYIKQSLCMSIYSSLDCNWLIVSRASLYAVTRHYYQQLEHQN